ncbi:MAG: thioesterase family protein, partial [Pseudomonadota bacterium]
SGFTPTALNEGIAGAPVIVAHPFVPVYLLPLVEIVTTDGRSARAEAAGETLRAIGMHPLVVGREIDAHIADRLLEAVWREALWLVRDGVATTAEIDDAIRLGFGLRWAQMGLFETYRIGGGEAGMRHFLAQFGPALAWPWSKLTDVPEMDEALVDLIAGQSDAQSGHLSIRALERRRDDNLVAILRALKGRGDAAGQVIAAHEAVLAAPVEAVPLTTVERTVPVDWLDYNGHMNESRYGQVFSDAADAVMAAVGADADYVAGGHSYFTVDIRIRFRDEASGGEAIRVESQVLEGAGKKLRLYHRMTGADGALKATAEQLLIHVSLETRRACAPLEAVASRLAALATAHAALPAPDPADRLP